MRTDTTGKLIWDTTVGTSGTNGAFSATSLTDGGFVIAGHTNSKGAGGNDGWVIRTDSNGTASCAAGCADGSVEAGAEVWARADIAFCRTADNTLPSTTAGKALCAAGSHMCTAEEFRLRNDGCLAGFKFSGVVNSGSDCMMHDDGNETNTVSWKCRFDVTRQAFAGSCPGPYSASSVGLNKFENLFSGADTLQGAICCK